MTTQIEIDSKEINVQEGTSARTGNDYKIVTQMAWKHKTGDKYPKSVRIPLEDETKVLEVGMYDLDYDELITVGGFDAMELARYPVLIPVKHKQ